MNVQNTKIGLCVEQFNSYFQQMSTPFILEGEAVGEHLCGCIFWSPVVEI